MSIKPKPFTIKYEGIAREIKSEITISKSFNPNNPPTDIIQKSFIAIWDTGATNSVISKRVIEECRLKPTGFAEMVTVAGFHAANTYFVNFILTNNYEVNGVHVCEGDIGGDDVLIGMDIITLGDFVITNKNGNTVFTFRTPSIESIDFVENTYY